MADITPSLGEKISYNSKSVLLGLFILVGIILLAYTFSAFAFAPTQMGRLNTVFIAAISGILALGGTLISQLWGRDTSNRPVIYHIYPDDKATNVPLDTVITASFNKLMKEETINPKTFTLKDQKGGDVPGIVKLQGGNGVFDPIASLIPDTTYTATITKDTKDTTGNSLEADKVWLFSTGQTITVISGTGEPTVVSKTPGEDASITDLNTPIKFVFSKDMDNNTINNKTIKLIDNEKNQDVEDMHVSPGPDNKTVTITHKPLDKGKTYTVLVTSGVKDSTAKPITNTEVKWKFSTKIT